MVSEVRAGLKCRCPRCGKGRLLEGLLKLAPSCTNCGLDYSTADAADGPAVFVMLIIGALVAPAMMLLEFKVEPPLWVHILLWPTVVAVGSLALLRPLKGLMFALQYKHKASEGGLVDYD